MPCHGCHLQMGQGAHQGSAPGKNHCTLPHSLSCQGGVVEDDSWRACPDGYVYHGQVVPGSGFVDTMNQSQFLSSTPILPHAGLQAHPHQQSPVGAQAFPQQAAPDVSAGQQSLTAGAARPLPQQAVPTVSAVQLSLASGAAPPMPQQAFPSNSLQMTPSVLTLGQQTNTGPVQSTPLTQTTVSTSVHFPSNITTQGQSAHAPPMYSTPSPTLASLEYDMLRLSLQQMGEGARPRTSVQPLADVSPGVQLQVDTLRAANQQVANASDPSTAGLNIADLRALPALQDVVNNQMQYLRGSVPALSAAKSAPAPGVQQQPPLSLPSVHLNFPTPTSGLQLGPASSFLPPQPAPQAGIHLVLPQSVHLHQPSQVAGVQQHQAAPVFQQHGGGVTGTPGQASSGPQYQPAPPVPVQHGTFQQQHLPSPASGVQQHQAAQAPHNHGSTVPGVQHSAPAPGFYQHTPGHQSGQVPTPGQASGGHQHQPAPVTGVQPGTFHSVHQYLPSQASVSQRQQAAQAQHHPQGGAGPGLQHPPLCTPQQPGASNQSAQLLYPQGSHIQPQSCAQFIPNHNNQTPVSNVQYYGVPVQPGLHNVYQQQPPQPTQPQLVQQPAQPQYKLEFRCSPTSGKTYQVVVPLSPSPPPVVTNPVQYVWRCDPATGVTFQVPVNQPQLPAQSVGLQQHHVAPLPQQGPAHAALNDPQQGMFLTHPQQSSQHQFYSQVSQQLQSQAQDKLRGITPLSGEATKKMTKVIDFARKCPVKWAKVAKADNINLPLYGYGAVTEIEAALSGRGEPLPENVLLAKIRHLKKTFEVCCLNSSSTDFSNYGWLIARDYATKVEDEVEQKFVAWQDMLPGVRTQTLVLSQMENPRLLPPRKKVGEVADPKTVKRDRCTTFNTCTTEMKCDYEVANSNRTCLKKHECSWCRSNLQQGFRHQVWKCLKKQAAGQ